MAIVKSRIPARISGLPKLGTVPLAIRMGHLSEVKQGQEWVIDKEGDGQEGRTLTIR